MFNKGGSKPVKKNAMAESEDKHDSGYSNQFLDPEMAEKISQDVKYLKARISRMEKQRDLKSADIAEMEEHLDELERDFIRSDRLVGALKKIESDSR